MIGPKVFTDEDKDSVREECLRLESKLDEVDRRARELSVTHNLQFDGILTELEQVLGNMKYNQIVKPGIDHMYFSAISRDILFKFYDGLRPVSKDAEAIAPYISFTGLEQDIISGFEQKFKEFTDNWGEVVQRWVQKQFNIYYELIGQTIAELPFEQPSNQGMVTLYVADPNLFLLRRYESYVDAGFLDDNGLSAILKENAFGEAAFANYHRDSVRGPVYVVQNLSSRVDGPTAALHVHRALRMRWKKGRDDFLVNLHMSAAQARDTAALQALSELEEEDDEEYDDCSDVSPNRLIYISDGGEVPDYVIEQLANAKRSDDDPVN